MAQYILLLLVNAAAMIVTKKAEQYLKIVPWLIIFIQLTELPVLPVLPVWYMGLTAIWLFCSIFFVSIIPLQNLFQAIPIFLALFILLPTRIFILISSSINSVPYTFLVLFIPLGLAAVLTFTIDMVGGRQRATS